MTKENWLRCLLIAGVISLGLFLALLVGADQAGAAPPDQQITTTTCYWIWATIYNYQTGYSTQGWVWHCPKSYVRRTPPPPWEPWRQPWHERPVTR